MSKYNNATSISISNLSEDEILQAIKEWSEGSESLENLLLTCRANGIETFGSHSGRGTEGPYLDVVVNQSHDKIRNMLCTLKTLPEASVYICPDGTSALNAAIDWNKSTMSLGISAQDKQSVDTFFYKLSESITRDGVISSSEVETFEHMLDFYDFFIGKESDTNLRLQYINGQYIFSVEPFKYRKDLSDLDTLFKDAGLIKDNSYYGMYNSWQLTAATPEEFNEKISQCKNVIIDGWPLLLHSEIVEGMSYNTIAHVVQRRFGDSIEGKKQFEEWLEAYRKIYAIYQEVADIITPDEINFDESIRAKVNKASLESVPGLNYDTTVHVIQRKFGDPIEGKKQFEEWLKEYKKLYDIYRKPDGIIVAEKESAERDLAKLIIAKGDEASLEGIKKEMAAIRDNKNLKNSDITKSTKESELGDD